MNDVTSATNYGEQIKELNEKIAFLEGENKNLSDTVAWMHNLIWDMYKKLRAPAIG